MARGQTDGVTKNDEIADNDEDANMDTKKDNDSQSNEDSVEEAGEDMLMDIDGLQKSKVTSYGNQQSDSEMEEQEE